MQITRASEYGVLGLLALSRRRPGEVVMLENVAEEEDIPVKFLAKIFQSLNRAGIVRSVRGSGGGFALSRPPEQIRILEIIEAIEGPIALQRCLDIEIGCEHSGGCALCGLLAEAQHQVKEVFSKTSLAVLQGRHIPAGARRRAVRTDTGSPVISTALEFKPQSRSRSRPVISDSFTLNPKI